MLQSGLSDAVCLWAEGKANDVASGRILVQSARFGKRAGATYNKRRREFESCGSTDRDRDDDALRELSRGDEGEKTLCERKHWKEKCKSRTRKSRKKDGQRRRDGKQKQGAVWES